MPCEPRSAEHATYSNCLFSKLKITAEDYCDAGETYKMLSPRTRSVPSFTVVPSSLRCSACSSHIFRCRSKACKMPLISAPRFKRISTRFPFALFKTSIGLSIFFPQIKSQRITEHGLHRFKYVIKAVRQARRPQTRMGKRLVCHHSRRHSEIFCQQGSSRVA